MKNPWLTILLSFLLTMSIGSCVSPNKSVVMIETPGYLYDSLVLELQPSTNHAPNNKQLEKLREVLEQYKIVPKQHIHFILRKEVKPKNPVWFRHNLTNFEKQHRLLKDNNLSDRHLILWMGFIPAKLMDQEYLDTIGLKYGPTSTVLLEQNSNDLKRVAVMLHEILHTQGLVDLTHRNEKPTNEERPSHCNDEKCTMFWIVPNKPRLCEQCQLDLHRSR